VIFVVFVSFVVNNPGVPTATTSESLERRLGPLDGAAIIVSNVIGGGILFLPPQIAASVPSAMMFLSTWVVGGLLAFMGALAYAELASLRPRAGGEYVYLRDAYGGLAGFLTGWTSFVAGFSGAAAANAIVLTFYLDRFIPGSGNTNPLFVIPLPYVPLTFSIQTIVACAAIIAAALVHIVGVGPGRAVTNVLAILKVLAFVGFIALGLTLGIGEPANLGGTAAPVTPGGWMFALVPIMFAYSGWNAAAYMAEEIKDPGRNVPLALALGTIAVTLIYLLMNVLFVYVMSIGGLAEVKGSVLDVVADRLLGIRAGDIMGIVSIVSLAASINAYTFAGPRVYFAMARDGAFFRSAARVHPKFKTPAASITAQALFAILLVLTGSLDALANYVGFSITLFLGLAVAAVFVLRAREPNAPRPFKAFGYPWTPGIFALAAFAIVVNAFVTDLRRTLIGAAIILAGIPLYLFFRRKG
jgi:APA family basic amino acid/polyamine antiporter